MKVSDPIMFGKCISVFYKDAFAKHGATLEEIGANPNQGLASIFDVVKNKLDDAKAKEIIADFEACYENRPWLAMVDSARGITNLHAPNDIIIDASMPVVIRDSGKMWNKLGVSAPMMRRRVIGKVVELQEKSTNPSLFGRNLRIANASFQTDATLPSTRK